MGLYNRVTSNRYDRKSGAIDVSGWVQSDQYGTTRAHSLSVSGGGVDVTLNVEDPTDLGAHLMLADLATGRDCYEVAEAILEILDAIRERDEEVFAGLLQDVMSDATKDDQPTFRDAITSALGTDQ